MNEEIEFILDTAKEAMSNAIEHLEKELRSIRAGKATPAMLGTVMVDYYGSQTPLAQVANVNTPDPRTLSIQPWEKSMLQAIEKAIQKSTNANLSSKLFEDDSNNEINQFVGFVSSCKKGTLLTSFHIHSFVVSPY